MNIHEICQEARHTRCACGAMPGRDCPCGPCGVCLSRVARARASRLISAADLAAVIHDGLAGNTSGTVLDPEVTR
jgi:hypothetical protein